MVISYSAALSAPMLELEEERNAVEQWQKTGDKKSLEILILSHARQIYSCVMKASRDPVLIEDLFAEGVVGLIKAVDGFDLSRSVRFSTYAHWWILNSVGKAAQQNRSVVKVPSSFRRPPAQPGFAELNIFAGTSLEAMDEGGRNNAGAVVQSQEPTPEEFVIEKSKNRRLRKLVSESLAVLNPLERDVIVSRNLNTDPVSFTDLAKRLGFSREHLRKVERRALSQLKFDLLERGIMAQGIG